MPLNAGTRLGPYEIVSAIGAGGMGEVYQARDTRLDRDVAVKIVSELFAADVERLIRFEREAKTLASLNHPNIAQIHGIEGTDIVRALVMEYVDGEDLAQRIARGPIPLPEALAIARQIADALDAAHERGIVHRDLKPANVKVRDDGTVKVLDFGLSKAVDPAAKKGLSSIDPQNSPTLTSPATQLGVILGTAAYMSPEQAKGKAVDKRADIWAFGAVLYEMLTGRPAFPGDTITDVLAHIVTRDPDWSLLPEETPAAVRHLLTRCLEREPKRRLRDIGDARLDAADEAAPAPARNRRAPLLAARLALVLIALALGGAAGWLLGRDRLAPSGGVSRFGLAGLSLVLDPWQSLVLTSDGHHLAYRGFGADGIDRVYVRSLDALEPRPVVGSEGGRLPFFSPDGTEVAFFAAGYLRKATLGTGSPQTVVPLRGIPFGGTWLDDGSIVYIDSVLGLQRVPRGGTSAETLRSAEEGDAVAPFGLPGSRAVLLAIRAGTESKIAVFTLADRKLKVIVDDGRAPVWSAGSGVIFVQGESIVRVPFDVERLTTTGPAEPVVHGIRSQIGVQSRLLAVAANGTLAYLPAPGGGPSVWSLVWVDRAGRETPLTDIPVLFDSPRLSPDGSRIVYRRPAPNCDLWSLNVARGTSTRLTLEGDNHGSAWSEDSSRVLFMRGGSPPQLLSIAADGGPAQPVGDQARFSFARHDVFLSSWLPRTGDLLIRQAADTFVVRPDVEPRILGEARFEDIHGVFSPDGKHVAYVSDESGRFEVYVQSYPEARERLQVSADGGAEPVWSPGGNELFFRQGLRVVAVDVTVSPRLALGRPRLLFTGAYMTGTPAANYDVSRDGSRFLMVKAPGTHDQHDIIVVLGAFAR